MKLKSYEFKRYKTKTKGRNILINIVGSKNKPTANEQLRFKALEEGTFLQETWFLNQEMFFILMNMPKG